MSVVPSWETQIESKHHTLGFGSGHSEGNILDSFSQLTHIMQPCFKIPVCLCQMHCSKPASRYERNCFLLTDNLSLAVPFLAHQSSQSDLVQQVHFWVTLWHIKTLFGIHTVLLYCLQASSKLFMDIARDRTHLLSFFNPKAIFYLAARFYVKAIWGGDCYVLFAFMWQVLWYQSHRHFITWDLFWKLLTISWTQQIVIFFP